MWTRPVLCRLCECPASEGGVRVDQLDAEKLSEWWRRTIGEEFEAEETSENEEVLCQFCLWDARLEHEYYSVNVSMDGIAAECDWWSGHDDNQFFYKFYYQDKVINQFRVMLGGPDAKEKTPENTVDISDEEEEEHMVVEDTHISISTLNQLAKLVRSREWESATEALQKFPVDNRAGVVKSVVVAVLCLEDKLVEPWRAAIKWVKQLEGGLRVVACEALHQQIKSKHLINKPQVLMLLKQVSKLSIGVRDDVRAELEADCSSLNNLIVQEIKTGDYKLSTRLRYSDGKLSFVHNFFVPTIVSHFDVSSVNNVLLLINFVWKIFPTYRYSDIGRNDKVSLRIVIQVLKALEEGLLLHSEQALHLWALVKRIKPCIHGRRLYRMLYNKSLQLLKIPCEKLKGVKEKLFLQYQRYIEHPDKQKIANLHDQSKCLYKIVSGFVAWYFNGDLERTRNLFEVARSVPGINGSIWYKMRAGMVRLKQTDTFEAFFLNNEANLRNCNLPACVYWLLKSSREQQQLRVINKKFYSPLSVFGEKVFCEASRVVEEEICVASVHPDTALTTFTFQASGLQLDAPDGLAQNGTRWMIKTCNDYVKIFTADGKFLTAGDAWQQVKSKRVVCLMTENNSDEQLWQIEIPYRTTTIMTRKRAHEK